MDIKIHRTQRTKQLGLPIRCNKAGYYKYKSDKLIWK